MNMNKAGKIFLAVTSIYFAAQAVRIVVQTIKFGVL